MRLYEGTVQDFNYNVSHNQIADKVAEAYATYYKKRPAESEYRSWQQSLSLFNYALINSGLTSNWIIIEYELPYSTRRIDVLLFGKGHENKDNIVLIELKQWSNEHVHDSTVEGNIVVDYGIFKREVAHPSLQVQGYHFDLIDFFKIFEEKKSPQLNSCVYCHNYSKSNGEKVLFYPKFEKLIEKYKVFSKEDAADLGEYLKYRLSQGEGLEVFNRFIHSQIRPTKKLLDHTSEMINKQQIFTLIDDQIAAYNGIMHKAKQLVKLKVKSVIIVKGGPGTGKSVIALEVMGELLRRGYVVFHATGSSAFTNTLRKVVGSRANKLFKFFFNFTQEKENSIDVIVCDEAHRLRAHSNDYGVPFKFRSKNPQIEDIIKPAKLSVFFLDEFQVVRPKEIGSVDLIRGAAKILSVNDSNILEYELKTQFRCSGSDAYLQWLDKIFGIRDTEITQFDKKMEFKIFDSPTLLKTAIDAKNLEKPNSARITAGFCWPWSEPRPDGSLVNDVKIGNFEMPWENKKEFWKWATDTSGQEQVGTVYTAQGFEFEYIGVIIGNDLVYDRVTKKWKAIPENSYDKAVVRNNQELTQHLKHVYRVLLSRAHKGVYVYFMDKNTEEYFKISLENR
ncbi:MAG: DUF2075 domain-containing protein [Candidatus Doudnabacteria bacterium]|nr:DUF2075 domain-containing protein [Candidatus Doudnabacteria bacterium]